MEFCVTREVGTLKVGIVEDLTCDYHYNKSTVYQEAVSQEVWNFILSISTLGRVHTNLENQGKPGKIKWSGKVRELFLFLQKVGELFF